MSDRNINMSLTPPGKNLSVLLDILACHLNNMPVLAGKKLTAEEWNEVIKLADQHKLIPTFYKAVTAKKTEIPEPSKTLLKYKYGEKVYKSLGYSGLASKLAKEFGSRNISFKVLKGPFLSQQAYSDLISRQFSDLDILVDKDQLETAADIIASMGFHCKQLWTGLNKAQKKFFIDYFSDLGFTDDAGFQIELHWKLFTPGMLTKHEEVSFLADNEIIAIADEPVSGLSSSYHLFYLIIHGYKHGWYRLSWLWDVIWLLNRLPGLEIEKTLKLAKEQKLIKPLLQAIYLGKHLFNLDISRFPVSTDSFPVKEIKNAWQSIQKGNQDISYKGMISNLLYLISLKENFHYRKSVLLPQLTHPRDWEIIPLPSFLFPLYFLLHPLILIFRRKKGY